MKSGYKVRILYTPYIIHYVSDILWIIIFLSRSEESNLIVSRRPGCFADNTFKGALVLSCIPFRVKEWNHTGIVP